MTERVAVAHRILICDICGRRIPFGTEYRVVYDDFMPYLYYNEHINCPVAPESRKEPLRIGNPYSNANRPSAMG